MIRIHLNLKNKIIIILFLMFFLIVGVDIASATAPIITFVLPTPSNASTNTTGNVTVNTTVSDTDGDNMTALLNWNSDLENWWRANEVSGTVIDSIGTHNGTLVNGTIYVTGCIFGNCLYFNGFNQSVQFANSPLVPKNSSVSIDLWTKPMLNNGTDYIFAKAYGSTTRAGSILLTSTNAFRFTYPISTTSVATLDGSVKTISQWYHVVAQYNNATGLVELYVNGILENSTTITANNGTPSATSPAYFGTELNTTSPPFYYGYIDDVKISTRPKSNDEINASYNVSLYPLNVTLIGLTDGIYDTTAYVQDSSGDVNNTDTRTFTVELPSPPASITNIANTRGYYWINWTWTEPTDSDLNYTVLAWANGTVIANVSNTTESYNITGLSPHTDYNISTYTVDTNGEFNSTLVWMNDTSRSDVDVINKTFLLNGTNTFPVFMWDICVQVSGKESTCNNASIQTLQPNIIIGHGGNMLLGNPIDGYWWNVLYPKYLANNVRWVVSSSVAGNDTFKSQYRNTPLFFGYHVSDEPQTSLAWDTAQTDYNIVKGNDTAHPAYINNIVNMTQTGNFSDYQFYSGYRHVTNLSGQFWNLEDWLYATQYYWYELYIKGHPVDDCPLCEEFSDLDEPVILLTNAIGENFTESSINYIRMNLQETRADVYNGLTSGMGNGIGFYSYVNSSAIVGKGIQGYPDQIANVTVIAGEINTLSDILLQPTTNFSWGYHHNDTRVNFSNNPTKTYSEKGTYNTFNYMLKENATGMYLFIVNKDQNSTATTITITSPLNNTMIATTLGSAGTGSGVAGRQINVSNGVFIDTFDAYAVHIYEIENGTLSTINIEVPANTWAMFNNWTSNETFSQIASNESNDLAYSYYNVSTGEWDSYYVGYSYNAGVSITNYTSVMGFFDAQTTIKSLLVSPSNTALVEGWNMVYLMGSVNKSLSTIKANLTDNGCDPWDVYQYNTSLNDYSNSPTYEVQPNVGLITYVNATCTWTRTTI